MRNIILPFIALLWVSPAAGQVLPPAARLPLHHWAVPYLEHLARKGAIDDPTPLMRPWRVGDIRAALVRADSQRMSSAELRTRRDVLDALQPRLGEIGLVGGGDAGLLVSSHGRRPQFSLRHTGPERVTPQVTGLFGFWFGPAFLMMHAKYDEDLESDPDYAGVLEQLEIGTVEAYGAFHSKYLDIELGNMSRNWGPPGFPGLLVSDWPLSYDHLFVQLGPRQIHMNVLVTQLDDAVNDLGELARRFFLAHRLQARPWSWLDVAVWQGTILSGPNRNLELWYLNPIQPTYFARNQHGQDRNSNFLFGGDVQMRFGRYLVSGSAFLDDWDIQIDEPPAVAFTATVATSVGPASLWVGYTLVSNLAYRTNNPADKPLTGLDPSRGRFGIGVARNFSDYDQTSVRITLIPVAGLVVTPELTLLRQGEGDPRLPYPTLAEFPLTPTFFAGVMERTWRAALQSTLHLPFGLQASIDVGVHRIENAGHQVGVSDTEFVGTASLRFGLWRAGSID